jgi:DNA-binding MarR family transcriptional regulator
VNPPVQNDDADAPAATDFADAARQLTRALLSYLVKQAHLNKLGLIEYLVLSRACDEGGVTARDAARAFDLNTSTMTGLSDRLEKDKLVRRHAHPTDRRVLVLKATARGRAVIAKSSGQLLGDLEEVGSALDPEQQATLMAVTKQVTDRLLEDI